MATLSQIQHIVVLMLENRSFDSLLGTLYPAGPNFNGLTGDETNPLHGQNDIGVWNSGDSIDPANMSIPTPDPGELLTDINMQLFGLDGQPGNQPPAMNGFVNNYVRQTDQPSQDYQPESIMHYYIPEQIPVISALAKQFAVCDQWFASAPCQTWPNRFFAHTGTAGGYPNNSPPHFPYLMHTIFNRCNDANQPWKIYFHDFPQTLTLTSLWPHLDHFARMDDFEQDARNGKLPAYTFIEPRYFPDLVNLPNDQHPPHNIGFGEALVAQVYNAVRAAPTWRETLLIVTYDEHGGCYDHCPPPLAVSPDNSKPQPFGFDRYGVRVPAVLISPYIKPGTALRITDPLPHQGPPYPFDHTSIIATVRQCFNLGPAMTQRDAVAPTLEQVLTLDSPTNDGPETVTPITYTPTAAELQSAQQAPMNNMQKALHAAATHLPPLGAAASQSSIFQAIEDHVEKLAQGIFPEVPNHKTPADALPFIQDQLRKFMGR